MGIEQYKRSGPPEETPMTRLSPPAESRPGFSPELVKELARQAQEIEGYNSLTLAGAIRYLTHDIRYGGRGEQGDLERLVKAELQLDLSLTFLRLSDILPPLLDGNGVWIRFLDSTAVSSIP